MGAFINLLDQTAQLLLDLDPDGKEKFAALQGKVMQMQITAPEINLYLIPTENGLKLTGEYDAEADVVLTGSLMAFIRLGRPDSKNTVITDSRITMQGDTEAGQSFQEALTGLDVDWEELLSHFVGDAAARKIGNMLRGLDDWAAESADLSRENAADYLQEEKRILVTRPAWERFADNVDSLREEVDRLQRRIARLNEYFSQDKPG